MCVCVWVGIKGVGAAPLMLVLLSPAQSLLPLLQALLMPRPPPAVPLASAASGCTVMLPAPPRWQPPPELRLASVGMSTLWHCNTAAGCRWAAACCCWIAASRRPLLLRSAAPASAALTTNHCRRFFLHHRAVTAPRTCRSAPPRSCRHGGRQCTRTRRCTLRTGRPSIVCR